MSRKNLTKNNDYFKIKNENTFYWAGFLMADGCIYKKSLKISLAKKDKSHLEKLREEFCSKVKIIKNVSYLSKRNKKWKDSICYHLTINSKEIVNDLKYFGLKPRKSLTAKFPNIKSSPFINAYCRGYLDGDGCIYFSKKTKKRPSTQMTIGFRGSDKFLSELHKIIYKNLNLPIKFKEKTISNNSKIGYLRYTGNNICTKIIRWLYKDSSIFLERKYNKVKNLI